VKLQLNTNGNLKQKEACRYWIDDTTFDIGYGGTKGSGKSYLGCSLIFGDAFIYPKTHYFIARKELNDLRKYTTSSIYEVFEHWKISDKMYRYDGKDNFWELHNGSHVFFLEAAFRPADPLYQRFGSMQNTRGWIEEAGEISVAAKNNLAASIGRWKNDIYNLPGKLLQTCNPSKNYLYRDYYKKHKDGTLESWKKFIQALPGDNKKLPAGYLENLERILSKNEKERLLKGNWEFDDDPSALCEYEDICNIFTNAFVKSGQKYITADIARLGKDTTTVRVWEGWRVIERIQRSKLRIPESADLIKLLANKYSIPMSRVIVDEGGVGGGVVDLLNCVGFVANARPLPTNEYDANGQKIVDNFDMLKSQCGFKLADKIKANEVYEKADPTVQDLLIEQLEQLKQKSVGTDLKKGLMPKDEIISNIGYSPDDLDTYIMRAYFEFKTTSAPVFGGSY
jgi:phage terminase large subunit